MTPWTLNKTHTREDLPKQHKPLVPSHIKQTVLGITGGVALGLAIVFRLYMELSGITPTTREIAQRVKNCMRAPLADGWCNDPNTIKQWVFKQGCIPDPNRVLINESTGKPDDPPETTESVADRTIAITCR